MDRVSIHELRVETRIGVTEQERLAPRPVVISIDIWTELMPAGKSDDLGDTIDYSAIASQVAELVRSTEAKLLEHLAEKIATLIGAIEGVNRVSVEVTKESPPMTEEVKGVSVRIERPPA